jgi:hypothetical protein
MISMCMYLTSITCHTKKEPIEVANRTSDLHPFLNPATLLTTFKAVSPRRHTRKNRTASSLPLYPQLVWMERRSLSAVLLTDFWRIKYIWIDREVYTTRNENKRLPHPMAFVSHTYSLFFPDQSDHVAFSYPPPLQPSLSAAACAHANMMVCLSTQMLSTC